MQAGSARFFAMKKLFLDDNIQKELVSFKKTVSGVIRQLDEAANLNQHAFDGLAPEVRRGYERGFAPHPAEGFQSGKLV